MSIRDVSRALVSAQQLEIIREAISLSKSSCHLTGRCCGRPHNQPKKNGRVMGEPASRARKSRASSSGDRAVATEEDDDDGTARAKPQSASVAGASKKSGSRSSDKETASLKPKKHSREETPARKGSDGKRSSKGVRLSRKP
jgi:hypothetical protein